jgi:hypothetical protein
MALRKPIVQVGGELQQLQAGDTLDVPSVATAVVSDAIDPEYVFDQNGDPVTVG